MAIAFPVRAQVTIGAGEAPEDGALLQLKDIEKVTTDGTNATKGLVLPRVSLSSKTDLYPMFLSTPSNPASGPNAQYSSNKASLDAKHTGMMVYNTNTASPFEEGTYTWDGGEWILVTDENSQIVHRLVIPINMDISTETVAFYGEIQYGILPPDIDEYALLSLIPIVTGSEENFVPENLFFSYSLRREEGSSAGGGTGRAVWKLKIDNVNADASKSATVEEVQILYTCKGSHFQPVQVTGAPDGTYATVITFGTGTNP